MHVADQLSNHHPLDVDVTPRALRRRTGLRDSVGLRGAGPPLEPFPVNHPNEHRAAMVTDGGERPFASPVL